MAKAKTLSSSLGAFARWGGGLEFWFWSFADIFAFKQKGKVQAGILLTLTALYQAARLLLNCPAV